jgi:pimeloyl-ACP methyl ester carboxylesterase
MASKDDDRRGIGLRDFVNAVTDEIDRVSGPVVLVGHSAGGAIAHAAADARPERVSRVIYVDSMPLGEGDCVNAELPVVGTEIPLPDWSVFGAEDLVDLSEEMRTNFREIAIPVPARAASDPQELHDARRYDVASMIIACAYSSAQLQRWIAEGHPGIAELGAMKFVEYLDLPTGHWPHLTKPEELADVLVAAIGAHEGPRD